MPSMPSKFASPNGPAMLHFSISKIHKADSCDSREERIFWRAALNAFDETCRPNLGPGEQPGRTLQVPNASITGGPATAPLSGGPPLPGVGPAWCTPQRTNAMIQMAWRVCKMRL